jgi:hypothetical protein
MKIRSNSQYDKLAVAGKVGEELSTESTLSTSRRMIKKGRGVDTKPR